MSTSIQLFFANSIQVDPTRKLDVPSEAGPMYVRTIIVRDDEGHKTEIDLFSRASESLELIVGPSS